MSLSPAKAQAKVLRLQRRAARVLHLLPRVGLCFTGDYSGLGAAFRTEGWSKEASKWFFCGRENKDNQRQIRLLLAWAKGNGERITVRRSDPRRFYSEAQLRVQGIFSSTPRRQLQLHQQPEPDWDAIERDARAQLAARKAAEVDATNCGTDKVAEEGKGAGGGAGRDNAKK